MAGMQFEYDEQGGTFYYFILSFWVLVLFPATYYLWPRKSSKDDEAARKQCGCHPCQVKRSIIKTREPWTKAKQKGINICLVFGWIVFLILVYKVSKIQMDYVEYDPFTELGVDRGASTADIKKAYRKLSLKYHPDRETGDSKKFMRIAKAYSALTDEESRKNWEEYGNPDGPGVTRFGIALPKWIVERENSMWVLAVYGLVFMIFLPVVVGIWWYRSIKFSADQVLLDTTQLYVHFFNKTPNMILRRVIMILGSSWEFDKFHNSEIIERPSDNDEIPILIRELPNISEKNKTKPLCFPYSIKARALVHAHLSRKLLPPNTLELDKQYLLRKCPCLINEMVNVVAQLVGGAVHGKWFQMPRLETIENCMKLSQMIIQGLEERSSPLLQLPHIKVDMLKHFVSRKRNIRSIREFVATKIDERRSVLRSLTDQDYEDVLNVSSAMPLITMHIKHEVIDDDDTTITAGSIVTVTVTIIRQNMQVLRENETEPEPEKEKQDGETKVETENQVATTDSPQKKIRVWEKQKKKVKKGGKPKKLKKLVHSNKAGKDDKKVQQANEKPSSENGKVEEDGNSDHEAADRSDSEAEQNPNSNVKDDDDDWSKYQAEMKKETVLETKAKESHPVHCPYFPMEKQECWWLYVADRKNHMLITAPVYISSLKDEEKIELKFSAPRKPGLYQYSVILRSDSYIDFDQIHIVKLDVKQAKVIDHHPQWEISDDEEDKKEEEASEDSDYSTDDEESDYE